MEVRGYGTIDAEDAAAGGGLVGEAKIGEQGGSGVGEGGGQGGDVEDGGHASFLVLGPESLG